MGTTAVPVRDRTETLEFLDKVHPRLQELGVVSLCLLGSAGAMRCKRRATSDVDVLVEFERPVGEFEFLDVQDLQACAGGGRSCGDEDGWSG